MANANQYFYIFQIKCNVFLEFNRNKVKQIMEQFQFLKHLKNGFDEIAKLESDECKISVFGNWLKSFRND